MPNVVIYARKSTESEDRQILSIDSQVAELKEFADREKLTVVQVFIESKSAKEPGRPVFNHILSMAQKRGIDGLLCWKLDRLARNPVDGGAIIWAMEQRKLNSIYTPSRVYQNTGSDKFIIGLDFGIAKLFVDDLSQNVKRGMRAKVKQGWRPGLPPLGYLNDRASRTVVKDPERFLLVRRMWDLMLTGNYSTTGVLKVATEQLGLRARKTDKYPGGKVAYSTGYKIFTNPFYFGLLPYGGDVYPGAHAPMITKAEFDRVQRILGTTSRSRPKRYAFAYTGLIRCGECGAAVTAEHKQNRRYGYRYVYYHCTRRKRNVTCSQKVIEEAELERQILAFLQSITIPQKLFDWTMAILRYLDEDERKKESAALDALKSRLTTCEKEISVLVDMRLRGLINDSDYIEKKAELEGERVALKAKIDHSAVLRKRNNDESANIFELALNAQNQFKNGSTLRKRKMLHDVGSNLTLMAKTLSIVTQKPFQMIQQSTLPKKIDSNRFEPPNFSLLQANVGSAQDDFTSWFRTVVDVRSTFTEQAP